MIDVKPEFSEGVSEDGVAILMDGVALTPDEIVKRLQRGENAERIVKEPAKTAAALYADFERTIKNDLQGFHIMATLFPAGGMIEAEGCELCNTDDAIFEMEKWNNSRGETMCSAVSKLKDKLKSRAV